MSFACGRTRARAYEFFSEIHKTNGGFEGDDSLLLAV